MSGVSHSSFLPSPTTFIITTLVHSTTILVTTQKWQVCISQESFGIINELSGTNSLKEHPTTDKAFPSGVSLPEDTAPVNDERYFSENDGKFAIKVRFFLFFIFYHKLPLFCCRRAVLISFLSRKSY